MFNYIYGKIIEVASNYVVLDNNGIGYHIMIPNPYVFHENEECKIYIYQHVREDEISLYGFKSIEEKELFLKLIEVKGIGPKMTLPILATGSVLGIMDAIERENILYLKKFPKIGDKVARQIILDLKGKFNIKVDNNINSDSEELILVLKGLGYKMIDINKIISKIDLKLTIEEQVKEALKLLLK